MLTVEIPAYEYNKLVQGAQQLLAKRNSERIKYEQEIEKYNKNISLWKFWKRISDSNKYGRLSWLKVYDAFNKIKPPKNLNIELCKTRILSPEMAPWTYNGNITINLCDYNQLIKQEELLTTMRK